MAAPIDKYDGDAIGATITFSYKGPAASYNVGVIVETKPHVIYMMKEHSCEATYGGWSGQLVTVDGVWAASFLDPGDLVTCLLVIYPSGIYPVANGDGSLVKKGLGEIYVHRVDVPMCVEGTTKCVGLDLHKCVDGAWQLHEANSPTCAIEEGDWWEGIVEWLNQYWYVVGIGAVLIIIMAYVVLRR